MTTPRSFFVERVSDRVAITVRKITTLKGSPPDTLQSPGR